MDNFNFFKKCLITILLVVFSIFSTTFLHTEIKKVTKKELKKIEERFLNNSNNNKIKNLFKSKLFYFLKNHYQNDNLKPTLKFCKKATYYFPHDEKLSKIVSSIYFNWKKPQNSSEVNKKKHQINIREKNKITRLLNKAFRYYKENKLKKSKLLLKKALSLNKKKYFALYLLGQISFEENKLKKALSYWKKIPNEKVPQLNIAKKIRQVERQLDLQRGFKKISWKNFNFYAPSTNSQISYSLRSKARGVYRKLGKDFNYYPEYKIPIILYSEKRYKKISDKIYPTAGLYDGKIRLPLNNPETLSQVLKHEYTHLIMKDLAHGNLPIWFNEGIAEFEANIENWRKVELKKYCQKNGIIPLSQLNNIFIKSNDKELISIAYTEAYAFIDFIVNRYNRYTLLKIINDFKKEKSQNKIFKKRLGETLSQLTNKVRTYIKENY